MKRSLTMYVRVLCSKTLLSIAAYVKFLSAVRPAVRLQCMHWKQRQDKQQTVVFKLDNHMFLSCYSHSVSADYRGNIYFTCSMTVAP